MADLGPLVGGGAAAGVFGVLAYVIGWLLKAMRDDRREFGKEIDDAEARGDKAEQRAERLQDLLDAANEERRKSLDLAAEQGRLAASHAEDLRKAREQIERLREQSL